MNPITTLLIILALLIVGINLAANNSFNGLIVKNLFFDSHASKNVVRLIGVGVLSSIILILLNMYYYALTLDIILAIVFTFLAIQGRAKVKRVTEQKKIELELRHKIEIEQRKLDLEKTRSRKIKEMTDNKKKPQSVKQLKDKLWNDGSLTNKDMINHLKK